MAENREKVRLSLISLIGLITPYVGDETESCSLIPPIRLIRLIRLITRPPHCHKEGFAKGGVWKWRLPTKGTKTPLSDPYNGVDPLSVLDPLSEDEDKPKTDDGDDASEYEKATRGW